MDPKQVVNNALATGISYESLTAYIDGLHADGTLSDSDYNKIILYILANGNLENSPRDLIQIRRGDQANLPNLAQGELGYCLDTDALFVGGLNGNKQITNHKKFRGRKFILITDSMGTHPSTADNWLINFKIYSGMTEGENVYTSATGGAGFYNSGFINQLNTLNTKIKNHYDITDIVVVGGGNDASNTFDNITASLRAFANNAHSAFPNATLWLGFCGGDYKTLNTQKAIFTTVIPAYLRSPFYGGYIPFDLTGAFHDMSLFESDLIHPNTKGAKSIAQGVLDSILGSPIVQPPIIANYPMANGTGALSLIIVCNSNNVSITINGRSNLVPATLPLVPDLGLCTVSFTATTGPFMGGVYPYGGAVPVVVTQDNQYSCPGWLYMDFTTKLLTLAFRPQGNVTKRVSVEALAATVPLYII